MPNFTNKARLKKPLGTEYFNINDMNENMDKIEDEFYTPNYSEELLNENVTSFKVGTGRVDGVAKDYTENMEQSLVSLDNVIGDTTKSGDMFVSRKLGNISIIDINNSYKVNLKNPTSIAEGTEVSYSGESLVIKSLIPNYTNVGFIETLEPNTQYTMVISCEAMDGIPHTHFFTIDNEGKYLTNTNIIFKDDSDNITSYTFRTTDTGDVHLYLYPNASNDFQANKTVIYHSITFYKSKVCQNQNITLKSIDNKRDTYTNGQYIQRISKAKHLSEFDWSPSSTNNSNLQYLVFYAQPPDMAAIYEDNKYVVSCNYLHTITHQETGAADNTGTNGISGHSSRGEIRIKIDRQYASTVAELLEWSKNGVGVYIQYELAEPITRTIPVNIVANGSDIIHIDTPVSLSCTHTVQLNTKAQIEELQKVIQDEKKNIWQKIRELIDVKYQFGDNGYIKLPTIFGGLIIQWGGMYYKELNWNTLNYKDITLPITFSKCYSTIVGVHGHSRSAEGGVAIVMKTSDDAYTTETIQIGINPGSSGWCGIKYIAVGK